MQLAMIAQYIFGICLTDCGAAVKRDLQGNSLNGAVLVNPPYRNR